jgi:DNA polymerase III subunit alpha
LRYLSVEQEAMQHVEQCGGKPLDPTGDGLDDEPTYRMLAHGTTVSVFHLERPGMQALLRELQPSRFEDIVAALSLNRPAMRGLGVAERYLARKRGRDSESVAHPELQEVLGGGPLLHQEQLIQAAVRLAGFDLEAAESLRSAIRRRSWSELAGHRSRFLSGALDRGIELERGEEIFDLLVGLGPMTDVRAHTVAYALLAYRSAYLATHHPVEYCLALLNHCVGEPDRTERILADAIDRRIRILDVDVNRSAWRCELEGGAIRMGLVQVRGLAETEAERIVADRRAHGPYGGLEEFSLRMGGLGKRALGALVRAGAFAGVGVARSATAPVATGRSRDRKLLGASQLELGLVVGCGETGPLDRGSERPLGPILEGGQRGTRRRGVSRPPRGRPGRAVETVPRLWVAGQIRSSTAR